MSKIKTCVSLYSLQDEYLNKRMDLEQIFKFLSDNEVVGIEFLPDQMMHNTPDPNEEDVKQWHELLAKYNLEPVIADVFLNTNLYHNRTLTEKESVELLKKEIILASELGFEMIRLVSMVPSYVIEPLIPVAEEYNVKFALEIHAALGFDVKKTQDFIEEMKRVDSPHVGLVIDTGIFCRKLPRVLATYCLQAGTSQELVDLINQQFEKGTDARALRTPEGTYIPEVEAMAKTEADKMFLDVATGYENEDVTILDEFMPYIFHFHFKLFEMTEEGTEYSINYYEILEYLHGKGYDGYVSTEYEGNRWTLPGEEIVEKEQVKMHQKHIRECLMAIQGEV